MMRAHLPEAAIVLAILANEDRLHCALHVVVDAAPTGALEECERPFVLVEHHLLRFARIGARTNIMRLWQRRTCATFTIVVTPSITTISWLQSN